MANNRDVSLTIRAKNEADRTIKSVAAALDTLGASQQNVASSADAVGNKIDALQNQLSKLEGSAKRSATVTEQVTNAVTNQAQRLLATNAAIAERKARIDELNRALGLLAAEADKAFIGPRRNGLEDQIRSVKRELKSATTELSGVKGTGGLTRDFEQQIVKLRELRDAQRTSQHAQRQAESAATSLSAEIANQTRLINENSQAARRAAAAQQFFNNKFAPGVGGPSLAASDQESIAAVLRVAEARDIEIQKLREEAAAVRVATDAQRQYNAVLDRRAGKSAQDSAAAFGAAGLTNFEKGAKEAEAQAVALAQMGSEAAQLRAVLNPLEAAQKRVATEQAKLNAMMKAGVISEQEQRAAVKLLAAEFDHAAKSINGVSGLDSRGRPSMFGLKPYELQNLGYQVNDVVTQLASGTSLTQTLAQQGGQILQLFPRVGAAVVAGMSSAPLIAFTAGLATLALAINEAANRAEELRKFEALLAVNADGAERQAEALRESRKALDQYGLSAEQATSIVRALFKEGFDEERIVAVGRAAKDMADVFGGDVVEAATQLAKAFNGTFAAVEELDKATNIYSASELRLIRTLFEQGRATEAVTRASDIAFRKLDEGADKARSNWSEAFRELGNSYNIFIEYLSNTAAIRNAGNALDRLGGDVTRLLRRLNGLRDLADVTEEIGQLQTQIDRARAIGGDRAVGGLEARMALLRKEAAALERKAESGDAGTGRASAENLERQQKANDRLEAAARKREASEGRVTSELDIQNKLAQARIDALDEANRIGGQFASDEAKRAFAEQTVAKKKVELEKQLADYRKQQANEAERARKEQERGFAADIANNGRDDLIRTAQRFEGFSENNPEQRGDLMAFFKQNGISVDPKMVAWCAAFVNAVLATNGLPGTGKLNAKSFLGFGQDATSNPQVGDIVILNRGPNPAEGHVGFFQGFDEKGNVKVLGGNQGNKVGTQTFNRDDVVGIRRAPSQGQVAVEQQRELEELQKKQDAFNLALDNQIDRRRADTAQLREQVGLQGEALLAIQREAAIEDALLKARQDAEKAGVATGDPALEERLRVLREVTGAYFDAAHARDAFEAQRNAVDRPVADLTALRDSIQQQMQFFHETGQFGLANQLQPQLDDVNGRLTEAIQKAKEFYDALGNNPEALAALGLTGEQVDAIKLKLQATEQASRQWINFMGIGGQQIAQTFANVATSALDRFAQSVANGENVFRSLKDTFLQFASDFLRQIAQMIIQQTIFNLVAGILSSIGGSVGGVGSAGTSTNGFGAVGGIMAHEGGIVGGKGPTPRAVLPQWFSNAARYHTGGIAGLKPNEVPAVLERGEEVLTRGDPRHQANGGGGQNIRIVNTLDPGEFISKGLGTPAGEKSILNFMRANSGAVKAAIGG